MNKKQEPVSLDPQTAPPPTVPVYSWAEARADYKRGPVLCEPSSAAAYFREYIGGKETEAFLVMYLDHRNHVLDVVLVSTGTVDHAAVYPREILKRALELNASGLILAHNHPGGALNPSEADKFLTRQITDASRAMGILVHDHIIVAHEGSFSFRQAGLI